MQQEKLTNIYTVSRLNRHARLLLEGDLGAVWLTGEISNLSMPASGHWYFSLKDSQSQLRCAMFRGNNRSVGSRPKNGDQVLIFGKVTLYEPRGDFQLVAQTMAPAGEGLLKQQFEALKNALAAEGLFAAERKRPLPAHPARIGIISSPTGAAVHDILTVLARRAPQLEIILYPSQVQGESAVPQLVHALNEANRRNETDLLLLARGGGSLEDLWCFNDERLVRAIAASRLPVVSAVGHEVDVSLSDLVADLRAPTPSAAAELISQDSGVQRRQWQQSGQRLEQALQRWLADRHNRLRQLQQRLERQHPRQQLQQQSQQLDQLQLRLERAMNRRLEQARQRTEQAALRLTHQHPGQRLAYSIERLHTLEQRLHGALNTRLNHLEHQLALAGSRLHAMSPLATLSRGYSITLHNNTVLTDAGRLKENDLITTRLAQGEVVSRVEKVALK
ncbi:exodeoxyribonuclease VII large subunit [Oceanimonas sp. GK1]|uniref:exodeoxyribonuclease VII large subunit n=1 Tax=Oceanimonas sp. (strain GK1 / IBRC-M 10197) TaxID=511062 RepID=UPI0002495642|nr:exodeoxyribonuclease VII large subunit [Oceanimonas sp. GK1]AEY01624.1 exodeoxyribonuclease VII large subunit [Oceanimonas sp. GK1]